MKQEILLRKILLWGLAGFLILQLYFILQNTYQYISIEDIDQVSENIERQRYENEALQNQYDNLKLQISEIYQKMDEGISPENILMEEREQYRRLAGLTPVQGEGVIIIITDSDAPLYQDEDPNRLIVHDRDIQTILSELRNAGAEAISVNDKRVIFGQTEVYCNGPTIRIDDEYVSQPFIIKAIGQRKILQASINSKQAHATTMRQKGLFVEANTSISIEMPAYTQVNDFEYLKEE